MRKDKPASTALAALCALLAALAWAGPAAAQTPLENATKNDDVLRIPTGDPKMEAAKKRAQATLGDFLALKRKPKASMSGFTVKVPLWTGSHNEFVWLQPFRVEPNGEIKGVLNNTPVDTDKYKKGETLIFPKSAVADWGYFDGGRMMGNFTTCVLVSREPREEAEKFKAEYGLTCTE